MICKKKKIEFNACFNIKLPTIKKSYLIVNNIKLQFKVSHS